LQRWLIHVFLHAVGIKRALKKKHFTKQPLSELQTLCRKHSHTYPLAGFLSLQENEKQVQSLNGVFHDWSFCSPLTSLYVPREGLVKQFCDKLREVLIRSDVGTRSLTQTLSAYEKKNPC